MPKLAKKPRLVSEALCDSAIPIEHRIEMLCMLIRDPSPKEIDEIRKVLNLLSKAGAKSVYAAKVEELNNTIRELQEGPLRPAAFMGMHEDKAGKLPPLASVTLEDGSAVYSVIPDLKMGSKLEVGASVLLDRAGKAVLRPGPGLRDFGEEARLDQVLPNGRLRVALRGDDRAVFRCSDTLRKKIDSGEVGPGAVLLVNQRQDIAFDALPPEDGLSHYRFLTRESVPDVVAGRDIGDPPRVIEEVREHLRLEMTRPEIGRAYGLPRSVTHLLAGVAGSGKTLAVLAIWTAMYELMSEVTGVPVGELPPRVFKFRASSILNYLLGESDKNLDRFFDEIEQLAAEPFVLPDGSEILLPVLVVLEELDGVALQRGRDQNEIFDRLLTTLLQRLDPIRPQLCEGMIVFLGTSNEAQQLDAAVMRRIGGTVHRFGRLGRRGFTAVLDKQLRGRPLAYGNGNLTAADRERAVASDLTAWLFSPNGSDEGVVELSFVGASNAEKRFRRDFLTGALVNRAVQQACREAAKVEAANGEARGGVTLDQLARALDQQIRSVAGQVNEHNVSRFLDLPDAARVASIRRLAQPTGNLIELQNR